MQNKTHPTSNVLEPLMLNKPPVSAVQDQTTKHPCPPFYGLRIQKSIRRDDHAPGRTKYIGGVCYGRFGGP